MNKPDLVAALASHLGCPRNEAKRHLDATLNLIGQSLARGETVALSGFGTFSVRERPARKSRHPGTGQLVDVPASRTPVFRAAKALRGRG